MFIPIEYAYFAALKADKDLNAYAKSKKVAIVTPSNLFSVMQVVEQLWRVERTSKMLGEILKTGADMHARVSRFVERMDGVKTALTAADKAYTEADKALRGNPRHYQSGGAFGRIRRQPQKNLNAVFGKQPIEQTRNLLIGKLLRPQKTTGIHPWFFSYNPVFRHVFGLFVYFF